MRWVVVGVGIAGRARARAILADPKSELAGVWRGRFAGDLGVPVFAAFEDALAAADAVAIASPTRHHAEQVAAALAAGRHVVVEFPVARTPAEAEPLFVEAERQDLVLHVEHIELLTPVAEHLRAHVGRDRVTDVRLTATRPGTRVGDDLALGNVARLMRLVDACGPVAAVESVDAAPGRLAARLRLASGAPVALDLREDQDLPRETTLRVDDGRVWHQRDDRLDLDGVAVDLPPATPLFARDHAVATDRIAGRAAPYVTPDAILHVLDLVEALGASRSGPVPCHRMMRWG